MLYFYRLYNCPLNSLKSFSPQANMRPPTWTIINHCKPYASARRLVFKILVPRLVVILTLDVAQVKLVSTPRESPQ